MHSGGPTRGDTAYNQAMANELSARALLHRQTEFEEKVYKIFYEIDDLLTKQQKEIKKLKRRLRNEP